MNLIIMHILFYCAVVLYIARVIYVFQDDHKRHQNWAIEPGTASGYDQLLIYRLMPITGIMIVLILFFFRLL